MTNARTLSTPPVGGFRAAVDNIVTMLWRDHIRTARQPAVLKSASALPPASSDTST